MSGSRVAVLVTGVVVCVGSGPLVSVGMAVFVGCETVFSTVAEGEGEATLRGGGTKQPTKIRGASNPFRRIRILFSVRIPIGI